MRGEHPTALILRSWFLGSSPHARGTPAPGQTPSTGPGIIPACAGNTSRRSGAALPFGDHPRMRGEHELHALRGGRGPGSSPHARGTPQKGNPGVRQRGIIPACAGNTRTRAAIAHFFRDHPRMRGEHTPKKSYESPQQGSSPHARGTRAGHSEGVHVRGIIPACAGNTKRTPTSRRCRRDHPRMRGEHTMVRTSRIPVSGSSPHARGTPRLCHDLGDACRIIPACAGNTPRPASTHRGPRDHPRMRGEHRFTSSAQTTWPGSSPHARGTRPARHRAPVQSGIIPACAGNTALCIVLHVAEWDHPRMRGEHRFFVRFSVQT